MTNQSAPEAKSGAHVDETNAPQDQPAAATAPASGRHLSPRGWAFPIAVVSLLAALLGTMYLGYTADPEKNLHDFPVALVNQDVGDTLDGQPVNFGDQITAAMVEKVPADEIDLRLLGINEARRQLQHGQVYGAIIIPGDFTKRMAILGAAAVVPGEVERPIITVNTNPRAGTYAASIMQRVTDRAMREVNATVGTQLTERVEAQLRPPPGGETAAAALTGAARLQLAEPINIDIAPYRPLPEGTGQGLSAFFYTLILLFAGFSGAMIIHSLVDSSLGYAPAEYGPYYRNSPPAPISRRRTLLLKWGVAVVTAPIVSAIFLGIATLLDMPVDHPLTLFLYGTLAVVAVAVTGLSVLAAFGTPGLVVNMVLFVVLGLPSSSGSIPIEATPRYIADLAAFEPMHQIYLAVRAILFFDGHLEAGLNQGIWMTVLGLGIGLLFGAIATHTYDLRGLSRLGVPHRTVAES
ncbi:DUF3533 domain-containing protein [Nocardia otitidiscaviarum]|uniref:YhgE/Pip domain-containing protein n=1 Tax=Nocardia otitidiscaviarum TaxID=1823 RepID=UPI00189388DE|nr:DUF3533 domain-containing protein [Nocardia otitidiscaviarum]MBF6132182.1 DUF3533 domain-containing protein [Nocardia otitidiscaviarum]